MATTEPNGGPGGPGHSSAEAGYVAARLAGNDVECIRELLLIHVWLPVKGPRKDYIVTHRGDQRLVRAYTSAERVAAVAGPDVDPAHAVRRRFATLVGTWRHAEIGLVINPDGESEFQIPRRLFGRVLEIFEEMTGGALGAEQMANTPERPRLVPIDPPSRIGGFRFAALVDGVDEHGAPRLSPERGTVESRAERRRIAEYLGAGAIVQLVPGFTRDVLDPAKGDVVPVGTRTDGEWIWSDGVAYYLETYGIAPEPEFHRTIVAAGHTCPPVTDDRVRAADRALRERHRIAGELHRRWLTDKDQS